MEVTNSAFIDEMTIFAAELAEAARAETLTRFGNGEEACNKGTLAFDPVTEADRAAEQAMRRIIEARFPQHGIVGEEYPERVSRSCWSWSLDPIDGTRSFISGMPSWTTLIALLHEGTPVLGLIDAPRLGELYLGHGTSALLTRGGRTDPLVVSKCRQISRARLSSTDPYLFDGEDADAFGQVRRAVLSTRYGHDAYAYARLAAGTIDLVVEAGLKPHDYNALIPVVRASGGVIGNWLGKDDFSGGKIVAAATVELFDKAVAVLRG